jgi:hypothetical protein
VLLNGSPIIGLVSATTCSLPLSLVLMPNGNMMLVDSKQRSFWSSETASLTACSCYTFSFAPGALQLACDDRDEVLWSSSSIAPSSSLRQLLSSAQSSTRRCIGTGMAAQSLLSRNGGFVLRPSSSGHLSLSDVASTRTIWARLTTAASVTALPGGFPRAVSLCLTSAGELMLTGSSKMGTLWRSGNRSISSWTAKRQVHTARVTDTGDLLVVNEAFQTLFSTSRELQGPTPPRMRPPPRARPPPIYMCADTTTCETAATCAAHHPP